MQLYRGVLRGFVHRGLKFRDRSSGQSFLQEDEAQRIDEVRIVRCRSFRRLGEVQCDVKVATFLSIDPREVIRRHRRLRIGRQRFFVPLLGDV